MKNLARTFVALLAVFVVLSFPSVAQQISSVGASYARTQITANRTYTVSNSTGNNNNTGLGDCTSGGFATIQHAIDVVADTLDLGNYQVTIQICDGTYAEELVLRDYVGGKYTYIDPNASNQNTVQNPKVALVGNPANIDGVILTGTNPSTQFRILRSLSVRPWYIDFLRFDPVNFQDAIEVSSSNLNIGTVKFGGSSTTSDGAYAIWVPNKSYVTFQRGANKGSDIYWGSNWGAFIVSADNSWVHMWEHAKWHFQSDVAFSYAFLSAGENSYINIRRLDSIDYGGHAVTGKRFDLWNNGGVYFSLNVGGEQPPSVLPGDSFITTYGINGTYNNANITVPNTQTNDYTLVLGDGRSPLYMNKASGVTVTLPNSFPPGWSTTVVQQGAGAVTFAAEAGGTLTSLGGATATTGQYGTARVTVRTNNSSYGAATWVLSVP